MLSDFYKEHNNDLIWWVEDLEHRGRLLFSFDKNTIFNLFSDYPNKLTKEQIEIFNRENPFWADFFSGRLEEIYQKKCEKMPVHAVT